MQSAEFDDQTRVRPDSGTANEPVYHPLPPLEVGALVGGRYQIVARLGVGGAGETYAAIDTDVPGQVPCVIKRLTPGPGQQQIVDQLKAEAHILEALSGGGAHARIPDLYQVLPDELCLVMTAIKGADLEHLVRNQPKLLTQAFVVTMLEDVCTALVFLHSRNVPFIHQDIKPKNLVYDKNGNTWLTDFGITETLATILNRNQHRIAWTDGYAPPEQTAGESEEGSDIYALAMTAAVLLNRQTPQQLDRNGQLEALRQQRPRIAAKLIRLIDAGLTVDIQQRPTARQILKRVRSLRAKLVVDTPMQAELEQINSMLRAERYEEAAGRAQSVGAQFSSQQRTAVAASIKQVLAQLPVDSLALARLYAALAYLHWRNQEFDAAVTYCQQGLKSIVAEPSAAYERALLLNRLGNTYGDLRQYDQAHATLNEALEACTTLDKPGLESQVYHNLGKYADENNQPEAAFQAYSTSLHLKEQADDIVGVVETLNNFGLVALKLGKADIARTYYQYCRDVCKQQGRSDMVAVVLANFGSMDCECGEWTQAQAAFLEAEGLFAQQNQPLRQALCAYNLGNIALELGDFKTALRYGLQTLELAVGPEGEQYAACAWRVIGKARLLQDNIDEAHSALEQAWQLVQTGEQYDQAFVLEALAALAYRQRQWALAQQHCDAALGLAREQHIPALASTLKQLQSRLIAEQS